MHFQTFLHKSSRYAKKLEKTDSGSHKTNPKKCKAGRKKKTGSLTTATKTMGKKKVI